MSSFSTIHDKINGDKKIGFALLIETINTQKNHLKRINDLTLELEIENQKYNSTINDASHICKILKITPPLIIQNDTTDEVYFLKENFNGDNKTVDYVVRTPDR